ncbi:MAG: putative lipid kinase YtlR [Myxococcota bacterium]|nr:putative lipid kinase YtlR [Myxococcota bacterium]
MSGWGKIIAVMNPRSAGGRTGREWPDIQRVLSQRVGPIATFQTESAGDGARLARQAAAEGAGLVLSVGGDGTHNEVVNGLLKDGAPVRPDVAFMPIPCGTGGDLVRTLGVPRDPAKIAELMDPRRLQMLDAGLYEGMADGQHVSRYFINIACVGLSALACSLVNQSGKWLGGRATFFLCTIRALAQFQSPLVRVRTGDGEWRSFRITNIAIANARYFGGGMMVAPDAMPNDGLFDVVIIGEQPLLKSLTQGTEIYRGKHVRRPHVTVLRTRTLQVESDTPTGAEVDGEPLGGTPARFTILPGVLRAIAPALQK